MVKIALVDDHTLFRNGLKGLLRTNSDYEVVGDFADGSQFIAALPELDVDIVFMDIAMPNMDGQRATTLALRQRPELKIIALTMFSEQPYAQQMIEAGVCGYINKDSDIQIVFDAVNSVMSGGKYFPQGVVEPRKLNEIDDFDALSDRELGVLTAICQGLSTPQIADRLEISKRTVDAHRARILEKTGCNNTASLVAYAIKNKLVEV
ncbi:MAG: response regulator transcription factor [Alistipes sp.]|nr:response regulator transcription factor [Alistipes sp.]